MLTGLSLQDNSIQLAKLPAGVTGAMSKRGGISPPGMLTGLLKIWIGNTGPFSTTLDSTKTTHQTAVAVGEGQRVGRKVTEGNYIHH